MDSRHFSGRFGLPDLGATGELGSRIAAGLNRGDAVALEGDLGAGKTTLARAILRALSVSENVPSPTFTLVQTYETPHFPVRHYDLYRVKYPGELDELGLDEALDEGAVLIEWPERAAGRIPDTALHVFLSLADLNTRVADITGPSRWGRILTEHDLVR